MIFKTYRSFFIDLFISGLFFIGFMIASKLFFDKVFEEKLNIHMQSELRQALIQYELVVKGYNKLSLMAFSHIINTKKMQKIMAEAKGASKTRQNELRTILYNDLKHLYTHFQTTGVRQLHFHLPDATSFLRMHRPEKFGDDLSLVRPSIVQVVKTGTIVHAFEEGRIVNGFRNVFPIYYENILVGTVEFSYGFDAFKDLYIKYAGMGYEFIQKKELYDAKVWQSEQSNYKVSPLCQDYVTEMMPSHMHNHEHGLDPNTIKAISKLLGKDLCEDLSKGEDFGKTVQYKDHYYSVVFHDIKNLLGKNAGYFVTYHKDGIVDSFVKTRSSINTFVYLGSFSFMILMMLYLRSVRSKMELLRKNAFTDPLTRIANRSHFNEALDQVIEENIDFCVIFFDLDHFKEVNDGHGHHTGDAVLKTITREIQKNLRKEDLFARWGGEEFVILLKHGNDTLAREVAEKLRLVIENIDFSFGTITGSFGVASHENLETKEAFMSRIDALLYQAKDEGRNRVIAH